MRYELRLSIVTTLQSLCGAVCLVLGVQVFIITPQYQRLDFLPSFTVRDLATSAITEFK